MWSVPTLRPLGPPPVDAIVCLPAPGVLMACARAGRSRTVLLLAPCNVGMLAGCAALPPQIGAEPPVCQRGQPPQTARQAHHPLAQAVPLVGPTPPPPVDGGCHPCGGQGGQEHKTYFSSIPPESRCRCLLRLRRQSTTA